MRVLLPLATASAVLVAAALAPSLTTAQSPAPPQRKPGWWETTMTMSAPMAMKQTMRTCTDAASEKANNAFSSNMQARGTCTQGPIRRTPAGWAFSSTCKEGKMTTTTSGVVSGDFNSGYRMEAVTRMSPAPMPQMAETRMTVDAKWLGACPAGRKPGDVVMANGMVMNMNRGR
jgi:hypothetical protein